jgi:hypothetical protein
MGKSLTSWARASAGIVVAAFVTWESVGWCASGGVDGGDSCAWTRHRLPWVNMFADTLLRWLCAPMLPVVISRLHGLLDARFDAAWHCVNVAVLAVGTLTRMQTGWCTALVLSTAVGCNLNGGVAFWSSARDVADSERLNMRVHRVTSGWLVGHAIIHGIAAVAGYAMVSWRTVVEACFDVGSHLGAVNLAGVVALVLMLVIGATSAVRSSAYGAFQAVHRAWPLVLVFIVCHDVETLLFLAAGGHAMLLSLWQRVHCRRPAWLPLVGFPVLFHKHRVSSHLVHLVAPVHDAAYPLRHAGWLDCSVSACVQSVARHSVDAASSHRLLAQAVAQASFPPPPPLPCAPPRRRSAG